MSDSETVKETEESNGQSRKCDCFYVFKCRKAVVMRRIDLSHAPRVRRLGNEADPEVLGSSGDQMKYDLLQQDEVLFTSYQKKIGGRKNKRLLFVVKMHCAGGRAAYRGSLCCSAFLAEA